MTQTMTGQVIAEEATIRVAPMKFDRSIGMALMVTVALETAAAIFWVGAAEARLADLERANSVNTEVSVRLARLEGETAIMRESLRRIEEAVHNED